MKNLILVIGRSGSGKDTLITHAKELLKDIYKIVSVPSYTDRPMRPTETDGVEHTFLTAEQFDELLNRETVFAYTKIGNTGFRYCSTVEQFNRLDGDTIFYTIDPNGYDYCSKFAGDFNMKVIYVQTSDDIRRERANVRNGDTTTWEKRRADENGQFSCFEERKPWDALITNDGELAVAENEFVVAVRKLLSCGM
jgi:guanylate kinase